MNNAIANNINSTVGPNDILYHLGDAAWYGHESAFWKRINCKTVLVLGNHDDIGWYNHNKRSNTGYGPIEVVNYLEVPIGTEKGKIVLSHYPFEVWHDKHKGWYHCYGHSHKDLDTDLGSRRLHVGVDTIGYNPMTFTQIKEKIEQRNAKATIT
jgi:calcineurin-like phosphoesterase family protein